MIPIAYSKVYSGSPHCNARSIGPKYRLSLNSAPAVCGKVSTDDAKMTGITPPEFTLSGRCVDCPPMILRPTTRLAYCTGMRRSLRSTKTMNATTATISTISISMAGTVNAPHAWDETFSARSITPRGRPTTMPAKISSDMPLPIPRSVICSPSHMMNTLPVVSVNIVIKTKPMPGLSTKSGCLCKVNAMPSDCTELRPSVR